MAPVPTTETALDRLARHRELDLEIAKLVSIKDVALRAAQDAQLSVQQAHQHAGELQDRITTLSSDQDALSADMHAFLTECREAMAQARRFFERVTQEAHALTTGLQRLGNEIDQHRKELADLRADFSREQEAMSRKRDDLEIWEERVRASVQINLPGASMKL